MIETPRVYLLERDGELLARMPLMEVEEGYLCLFEATPAFDSYRTLFEEEAFVSSELSDDAPPELIQRGEELVDQILRLGLVIRAEDGAKTYHRALLTVMGDQAYFLPLDEP